MSSALVVTCTCTLFLSPLQVIPSKKKIKELDSGSIITSLSKSGIVGVQQSLSTCLAERIKTLTLPDNVVRVKLSGDGTNVGKHLHLVNITFTLLDDISSGSFEGNHILVIAKCEENYDSLSLALTDIVNEVEELQKSGIEVEGVLYHADFYLGGDWKFLALITGINSASGCYACIWCKCPAEQWYDTSQTWSITDVNNGTSTRTVEDTIKIAQLPQSKHNFGVQASPIFQTIPLHHVVINNLHLFLRVTDTLIDLLILELRRQDALHSTKKFSKFDRSKAKHFASWETFLSSLGIPNAKFYIGKASKELKWRTLTGPEKVRVLQNIQISNLLTVQA